MDKPRIMLAASGGNRAKAADPAQAYRIDAARKLQIMVHRQVTDRNPLLSNEDALELIDAITLAAIKGLEHYLTGKDAPCH